MKTSEEYYKEIKALLPIFKQSYWYDKHTNQTCVNNALIGFLKMLDRGSSIGPVDSDDYKKYKGMMFICLQNEVNKAFGRKKRKKNIVVSQGIEIQDFHMMDKNPGKDQYSTSINQLIKVLKPKEKAFIRFVYKRGWSIKYAAREIYGYSDKGHAMPYNKLRSILNKLKLNFASSNGVII